MRALIDTGALLALASPRDQYHKEAVRIARRFAKKGGRWVGSVLVLAELHGHLLHRRGAATARDHLTALLRDPAFTWEEVGTELIEAAASAWLERYHDQRFSLTDAVSFEIMRRESLDSAFGFDRDFVTAGFRLLE